MPQMCFNRERMVVHTSLPKALDGIDDDRFPLAEPDIEHVPERVPSAHEDRSSFVIERANLYVLVVYPIHCNRAGFAVNEGERNIILYFVQELVVPRKVPIQFVTI